MIFLMLQINQTTTNQYFKMYPILQNLYLVLLFTTLAVALAPPAPPPKTLEWAALGDSWASGVTYQNNPDLDYDKGNDELIAQCRRIVDAYGYQMFQDNSWSGVRPQKFNFVACSGSNFNSMAGQADAMGNAEFATLTIGGNDAYFYDVVTQCIYQQEPWKNYGPAYPDQSGACELAIERSSKQVNSEEFKNSFKAMFNAILNNDNAKNQEAFQLYITGYAHFFNIDTDGCNTTSFGALPVHKPLLSTALRTAINGLVQDLNDMYQAAITEENNPKVHYVDISISPNDGFDMHRFCDIGITDQYNDDNLWFWNLNWPTPFNAAAPYSETTTIPVYEESCEILNSGGPQYWDWQWECSFYNDRNLTGDNQPLDIKSGSEGPGEGYFSNGQFLRPFHPKRPGHTSIKNAIMNAIRSNGGV